MAEDKTYKVLEETEIDGKTYKADDEVALADTVAAPLVESGKIEAAETEKDA